MTFVKYQYQTIQVLYEKPKARLTHAWTPDAGGVQVSSYPEAGSQGEARDDAALHPQAAQDADQVPGAAVEEVQHEDHVRHLPESAASPHRRLGLRQRYVVYSF